MFYNLNYNFRFLILLKFISAGFSHKDNPTAIDLNAVRLCFQAFLGGSQVGKYSILEPVVSDPIYDKSKFYLNFKNKISNIYLHSVMNVLNYQYY